MSSRAAKNYMRQLRRDIYELESAHYYYWRGDYPKASRCLMAVSRRLVVEPHSDTQEYKDGERKPETSNYKQPEPKEEEWTPITFPAAKRDADGYLIAE